MNDSVDLAQSRLEEFSVLQSGQWKPWIAIVLLVYPLLTAMLRFRRIERLRKQLGYTTRKSFSRMADDDAFAIQQSIAELEFPLVFEKALQCALFRVLWLTPPIYLL